MKKISMFLVFVFTLILVMPTISLAAPATYPAYTAMKGTITIDGAVTGKEWDGVTAMTVDKTNGNVPSWVTGKPDGLKIVYKFKWDMNYFYILEVRTNDSFAFNFNNCVPGQVMWMGDSTLFFIKNADSTVVQDFEYAAGQKTDPTKAFVQKRLADGTTILKLTKSIAASKISGKTATTEVRFAWDDCLDMATAIKVGGNLRISPVIAQANATGTGQLFQFDTSYGGGIDNDAWQLVKLASSEAVATTKTVATTTNNTSASSGATTTVAAQTTTVSGAQETTTDVNTTVAVTVTTTDDKPVNGTESGPDMGMILIIIGLVVLAAIVGFFVIRNLKKK